MQFFILVNWYRIDWFVWLPIILGLLVLVMIILRIIRWKTRWGPIQVSHVQESILEYNDDQIAYYEYQPPADGKQNDTIIPIKKVCLFVPPLGVKGEASEQWATSIALLGWRVLTLNARHIEKWFFDTLENKIRMDKFVVENHISHIILFDYSILPLLNNFLSGSQLQGKSILLCRPTIDWNDIRSLSSLFPFTTKWRARFRFNIFLKSLQKKGQINLNEATLGNISEETIEKFLTSNYISLIESKDSWLTSEGQEKWIQWKKTKLKGRIGFEFQFTQGNWDFYFQETLLTGIFARFLTAEE